MRRFHHALRQQRGHLYPSSQPLATPHLSPQAHLEREATMVVQASLPASKRAASPAFNLDP